MSASNEELRAETTKLRAEITKLRRVVRLAEMLIQPTDGSAELVGHPRFLKALLNAVRGYNYSDPFEDGTGLPGKIVEAAVRWRDAQLAEGLCMMEMRDAEDAAAATLDARCELLNAIDKYGALNDTVSHIY